MLTAHDAGWVSTLINYYDHFRIVFSYTQGIGDSGQGITNAIIFVFFTKKVRKELVCPCKLSSRSVVTIQRADENDQTSLLDDSEVVDPDYNPMNYTDEDTYTDQGSSSSLHL